MDSGAIIVSGAASGLGKAVAQHLNGLGAKVAGVDLIEMEQTPDAKGYICDVSDAVCVDAVVQKIHQDFGGITGLVTCAGIAPAAKLVGRDGPHDAALFANVLAVNTIGTFNLMSMAAARMKANAPDEDGQRGVIVTTASIAAFEGQIGQVAYAASKGAVAAMTLPAARELARDGIRVATIAPGIFDTPMLQELPKEVRASLSATIPFPPKPGDPDNFAKLVSHIFENKMLNGEVIRLDGALRMAEK